MGLILPRHLSCNSRNLSLAEAKLFSQLILKIFPAFIQNTNCFYLTFRSFCSSVFLSCRPSAAGYSAFFSSVLQIIFGGSKKQMIWIYARGIVAFMTNKKSIFYWANTTFIRKSVSALCSFSTKLKKSITIFVFGSGPNPAIIRFLNFIPESFHNVLIADWAGKSR